MIYALLEKVAEGIATCCCCGWLKESKKRCVPNWRDLTQDYEEELIEHLRREMKRRAAQGRCPSCC